ncbi:MAG TPA: PH domain-containing protein [Gemmatimonadaceae bacterium]|nr:PH domain-containing protein [Gemmatimonadaceae bacterium]
MSPYNGRRVFRSPSWMLVLVTLAAVIFASGAWYHLRTQGWSLMTLGFVALTVLGVLAIVETIVQRVVLADDALHITRWWRRRSYPRANILRVTTAKGSPAFLELADGSYVELPAVDANANSIRAWLKAKA